MTRRFGILFWDFVEGYFGVAVQCALFSVVSTSWQLLEDMGAEGATFGPVIRVGGRGKKSPGGRAAFVSWQGHGERC